MELLSKLWCFLRGHDMTEEARIDTGYSQYGNKRCLRCGKTHNWQYDYGIFES